MKTILINGVSAKSGGGKSVLTNLLSSICKKKSNFKFIVIVPVNHGYERFSNDNVMVIPFDDRRFKGMNQLYFYFFKINKIIKKYDILIIFNLADIIIPSSVKQLFLFDWAYAVYPKSIVWDLMPKPEYYYKKIKLHLFKKFVIYPSVVYAQTSSVSKRLQELYPISKTGVIPNAVSIENLDGGIYKDFMLPTNRIKFLCLSKYYVHKNIEMFIPLARLIKQNNLPYCIVITIERTQHRNAKKILNVIKNENLEEVIINVGDVAMQYVPFLYKQSDALLLPTLLESFSGTYVEAMYHEKPIFTSDMDFARDVCGEAAVYFDPSSPQSVLDALTQFSDKGVINKVVTAGTNRIKEFLTWEQVSDKIVSEIKENI